MKLLLSGKSFSESAGPELVFDSILDESPIRRSFPIINQQLTLQRLDDHYCIGGFNPVVGAYSFCPHKARIDPKQELCKSCQDLTGFNPAWYNANQISSRQAEINKIEHIVYLANFGPGVTKVGIASGSRIMTRWNEQGARAACIVSKCEDAYHAREIEHLVNSELKVKESVIDLTKRKLCRITFDEELAEKELSLCLSKIDRIFPIETDHRINFLDKYYFGNNLSIKFNEIIDLTDSETCITGVCLALIGNIILISNGNFVFIFSIKNWIGHLVEYTSEMTEHYYKIPASQKSLF